MSRFCHVAMLKNEKGFSLMELLIYISIVGVASGLLVGILTTTTKTQVEQVSGNKVSAQLSFAMQTIERLVQSASLIEADAGISSSTLTLRMRSLTQDPTIIFQSNGIVFVQQGTSSPQALTDTQVHIDNLLFEKISQYPGRDIVQIDLALSDTQQTPSASSLSSRSLVARASAAAFDFSLIPGSNTYDLGGGTSTWNNAYFSGKLGIASGGSLGIGTFNPASGYLFGIESSSTNSGMYISSSATSSGYPLMNLFSAVTTSPIFYVGANGLIGINTSTPSYGLDLYNSFHVGGGNTSTFDGNIVMGSSTPVYRIGNLAAPSSTNDAATKKYVDDTVASSGGGGIIQIDSYYNSGTFVWTKPSGATHVLVEVVGGGGGGGSGATGGNGGGSGGYCKKYITLSTSTYSVVVGDGGTRGFNGSGGNGGQSSFGGTLCVANGGGGGTPRLSTNYTGQGGAASGGDINATGTHGAYGGWWYSAAYYGGGNGGSSVFGGGGLGGFSAGGPGSVGGGGGGAYYSSYYGGYGGDGVVIITSYQ